MSSTATRGEFPYTGPAVREAGGACIQQEGPLPRALTGLVSNGGSAWAFADEDVRAAAVPRAGQGGRSEWTGGTHRGRIGRMAEQGFGPRTRVVGARGADAFAREETQGAWHTSHIDAALTDEDRKLIKRERRMRKALLQQYHPSNHARHSKGASAALVAVRTELRKRENAAKRRQRAQRKFWQIANDAHEMINPIVHHASSATSASASETSDDSEEEALHRARRADARAKRFEATLEEYGSHPVVPKGTWDPRKRPVVPADPMGLHRAKAPLTRKQREARSAKQQQQQQQHASGAAGVGAGASVDGHLSTAAAVVVGRAYAVRRRGAARSRAAERSRCVIHRGGAVGCAAVPQHTPTRATYAAVCGATVVALQLLRTKRGGRAGKGKVRVRICELPPVPGKLRCGDELVLPAQLLHCVAPKQARDVWRRVAARNLAGMEDSGLRLAVLGGAVISTSLHEATLSSCDGRAMDSALTTLAAGADPVSAVALASFEAIAMPAMHVARQACAATAATFAAPPRRRSESLLAQHSFLGATEHAATATGWARPPVAGMIAVVGGLGAAAAGRAGILQFLRSGEILDLRALRARKLREGVARATSAAEFIPKALQRLADQAAVTRMCAVPTHSADWKPLPLMCEARAGCALVAVDDGSGVTDRLVALGGMGPGVPRSGALFAAESFGAARILNTCEVLRIGGGSMPLWDGEAVPPMLRARADFACAYVRGVGIIACGGVGVAPLRQRPGAPHATALVRALREEVLSCCEVLPFSIETDGIGALSTMGSGADAVGLAWQSLAPLPSPRSHCASALLSLPSSAETGGASRVVLVLAGGFDASGATLASCVYLDVRRNQWVELPPLRQPRARCAGASFAGCFVVTGGQDEDGGGLSDAEAFDFATRAWTAVPGLRLSAPTAAHCSVAVL